MPAVFNKSEVIILSEFSEKLLDSFYDYRSDTELLRYQNFILKNKEQVQLFFEEQKTLRINTSGNWKQIAILDIKGNLIGDCALKLSEHDNRLAEIGVTIRREHQKKGFAKQAISLLLDYIFGKLNVHKCMAIVDVRNDPSKALFESLGFTCEAKFKNHYWDSTDEDWFDEWHYAMSREAWLR